MYYYLYCSVVIIISFLLLELNDFHCLTRIITKGRINMKYLDSLTEKRPDYFLQHIHIRNICISITFNKLAYCNFFVAVNSNK